jgi:dihydroceramide fatty acyl 2-hydroxylase
LLQFNLIHKVGHLGEDYEEWVHQPIMGKEGPRFFHSNLLEVHTLPTFSFIHVHVLKLIILILSVSRD